jgi:hypothetical protein
MAGRISLRKAIPTLIALTMVAVLAFACGDKTDTSTEATGAPQEAGASPTAVPLKQLNVEPRSGIIGTPFTISGTGLAPNKEMQLLWQTWDGGYHLEVQETGVDFHEARYVQTRVPLGNVKTDATGTFAANFEAPDDYGGAHNIFLVMDGVDYARGGFQIQRSVTIHPLEGPIGTPITITAKGFDIYPFGRAMAVRYNNSNVGIISGVTTRGTATAVIRAAGPVGTAVIEMSGQGVHGGGFLTNHQSPYAYLYPATGSYRFHFNVTADNGPPAAYLDWPADGAVAVISPEQRVPTSTGLQPKAGVKAELEPKVGPVGTQVTLKAVGLQANADMELAWLTVGGTGGGGVGQKEAAEIPLLTVRSGSDGSVSANFPIPDQLGGWHVVQVRQGGTPLLEVPFYTERSLSSVTPLRLKAGEPFVISFKGGGLYDLDNGFAVTYDNAYIGYGCGFTAKGPVTLHMVATGGPGTHIIDVYPMIYRGVGGTGKDPWGFQMPHINSVEDHPGLSMGMRLPIFRLAIEIVE